MPKKPEFYEGEEAAKRFEDFASALFTPTAKAPKPEPPKHPQSSAK
jgi:hypothetical protein